MQISNQRKLCIVYLSDQKAVITRQRDRHCRHIDIYRLSIADSLETTPHKACNLEGINILQPHQPISSPLEVFQFGQIIFFLLKTGPESWTREAKG